MVGTLADLPGARGGRAIGPPATLVVGAVAALAAELAWVAPEGASPTSVRAPRDRR